MINNFSILRLALLGASSACLLAASGTVLQQVDMSAVERDGYVTVTQSPIDNALLFRLVSMAGFALSCSEVVHLVKARDERSGPIEPEFQRSEAAEDPVAATPAAYTAEPTVKAPNPPIKAPPADAVSLLGNHSGHLMISCRTQSGKTTTIKGVVEWWKKNKGFSPFVLFDPKNSFWEAEGETVDHAIGLPAVNRLSIGKPETIHRLLNTLKALQTIREERSAERLRCSGSGKPYNPKPIILLVDEWPVTMKIAERMEDGDDKSMVKSIVDLIEVLIFAGAEDKIFVWMVSQTHFVTKNRLSMALRDNMGVWAQGRAGEFRSIEAAIGDNNLVPQAIRARLQKELKQRKDSETPVFYTNVKGHQIGKMPNLARTVSTPPKPQIEASPWDED